MKNKKKGTSSKTWAVDCRIDGAFDFALKVLKEAKNKKYPFDLKVNFVRIAYSNSLETIAKAQTDPVEFKLKTAIKMLERNLKEICKVAYELHRKKVTCYPTNIMKEKYCKTTELLNPYDYIDINYPALGVALSSPIGDYCLAESWYYNKDDQKILNCVKRYNFPKIYVECGDFIGTDILVRLMPTNDILLKIPLYFAELLDTPIDPKQYQQAEVSNKLLPFKEYIDKAIDGCNSMWHAPKPTLIHVPYDSFKNVSDLVDHAAKSPDKIKEIGITAYRLGSNSSLIEAITTATNNKIHCKLYIELSARGEIQQDLQYILSLLHNADPRYLDIRFHYNGIKVHAKMIYIELISGDTIGIFSTGNYNDQTARVYKDYHYISCEPSVGDMIKRNFSVLWNSDQPVLSSISNILIKEIYSEIAKGKQGRIWIQTNHLDNKRIVVLLKEAIHRGCDVKLLVRTTRGFHNKELKNCKTIVGKYLEHSRVYIFGSRDNNDRRVYLSSSDILFRNLYNRFESYIKINNIAVEDDLEGDFHTLYKNGQR